jgi:hypothetical protein
LRAIKLSNIASVIPDAAIRSPKARFGPAIWIDINFQRLSPALIHHQQKKHMIELVNMQENNFLIAPCHSVISLNEK